MSLGTKVGIGPGDTVLDGDPAPPKKRQPPLSDPYLLWPNGWMDQDATWYGCTGLGPGHTVLDGDLAAPQRGTAPPQYSAYSANIYCGQTVARLSYC